MADIEAEFESARHSVGLTVDLTILKPVGNGSVPRSSTIGISQIRELIAAQIENSVESSRPSFVESARESPTFGETYSRFMADPTRSWSARTRMAHETTRCLSLSIIGADTPIAGINRATCRELVDTLMRMPRHAGKRYPNLSAREVAMRTAPGSKPADAMSVANINVYLNKLGAFFNWATLEEAIPKNPAQGLRLSEPIAKREKRHPFSDRQLRSIFDAPLFRGCKDGDGGYAKPGPERPKRGRYWIPLLALYTGMRLNEICQLDVADIRSSEGISYIAISEKSSTGSSVKRLKTRSSERVVPIHIDLIALGFGKFVADQIAKRESKLFGEIPVDRNGYRSTAFSKWFTQFCRHAGVNEDRTCFHSFRHNFRDRMREAEIDRDLAHALGGWTRGQNGGADVADSYGGGYSLSLLNEAIQKIRYKNLDLSHLR